jgi:orotidine-5'-phosphate decarboxylase
MSTKSLSARERIIFPLDFTSLQEAARYIEMLKDHVGLFKVGLTLFVKEGPKVIEAIQKTAKNNKVFLDLKFHDIPETLGNAAAALMEQSHAIKFITVHTSEGEAIAKAVVDAMKNGTQVLGITVLTSLGQAELQALEISDTVEQRVLRLAQIAKNAGCAGIVCSGREAKAAKRKFGKDFIVVTPGIRPSWSVIPGDDQQRIMTPREAIVQGADYIVVGRPIYKDPHPIKAAEKVAHEIDAALKNSEKIK